MNSQKSDYFCPFCDSNKINRDRYLTGVMYCSICHERWDKWKRGKIIANQNSVNKSYEKKSKNVDKQEERNG